MVRSYNKLRKLMIDKKINKTQLCKTVGVTTNAMAKLGRYETVTHKILKNIYVALGCLFDNIIEMQINKE